MKKFFVIFAAAFLLLAGSVAYGEVECTSTYVWDENLEPVPGWVNIGIADVEVRDARLYYGGGQTGNCNALNWYIPIQITASVAQWVDFCMVYTEANWFIRKPGLYAANCFDGTIASNSDIAVSYENFGDLMPSADNQVGTPIPVWYGLTEDGNSPLTTDHWYTGLQLNQSEPDLIEDCLALHEGITYSLWHKILVVECNSTDVYSNWDEQRLPATIVLTLANQVDWIDSEGKWDFTKEVEPVVVVETL